MSLASPGPSGLPWVLAGNWHTSRVFRGCRLCGRLAQHTRTSRRCL